MRSLLRQCLLLNWIDQADSNLKCKKLGCGTFEVKRLESSHAIGIRFVHLNLLEDPFKFGKVALNYEYRFWFLSLFLEGGVDFKAGVAFSRKPEWTIWFETKIMSDSLGSSNPKITQSTMMNGTTNLCSPRHCAMSCLGKVCSVRPWFQIFRAFTGNENFMSLQGEFQPKNPENASASYGFR